MSRLLLLLLSVFALVRCTPPPPPTGQARADAETLAACREHANAVYDRNNRDTIYTISNRELSVFSELHTGCDRSWPGAALRS